MTDAQKLYSQLAALTAQVEREAIPEAFEVFEAGLTWARLALDSFEMNGVLYLSQADKMVEAIELALVTSAASVGGQQATPLIADGYRVANEFYNLFEMAWG